MLFGRWRAERFHQLLDGPPPGSRRRRSRNQADSELTPLVDLSRRTAAMNPHVELDTEFKDGLRALLVATAVRDGIGRTAQHAEPEPIPDSAVRSRFLPRLTRTQARLTGLAGLTVGAIVLSGISAASQHSNPNSWLYGLKRTTEQASLALTSSDLDRGKQHLDNAKSRINEAYAVRSDHVSFANVLSDMESDIRSGVQLLTAAAVQHRAPEPLDDIETFAASQRLSLGTMIGKLDATNRSRALWTMMTLDAVSQRAQALHTSLSCGVVASGSDILGPKPRACSAAPERTTAADPTRRTKRKKPGSTGPTAGASTKSSPDARPATPTPSADGAASTGGDTQVKVGTGGTVTLPTGAASVPTVTDVVPTGGAGTDGLVGGSGGGSGEAALLPSESAATSPSPDTTSTPHTR